MISKVNKPKRPCSRAFFLSEDVVSISQNLLGKFITTHFDGILTSGMIVETEAYRAPDDKACHAYQNKRTKRTETMFQQGGTAYVYLCYGIHHLFNIVTGMEGMAHAVLIRAIEPVENTEQMLLRRSMNSLKPQLTAGPGVMSKALGINTSHDGYDLCTPDGLISIEDRGIIIKKENIIASPRVGVGYAEECAAWPWRFRIKNSKWTSKAK